MKKPEWDEFHPASPQNLGRDVGPNVPFILTQKEVRVKTMTGSATVGNPMWKFALPVNPESPAMKTFGDYGISDTAFTKDGIKHVKHVSFILRLMSWMLTIQYTACKATSRQPRTYDPTDSNYEADWIEGETQDWRKILGQLRGAEAIDSNTLPERVYRLFANGHSYTEFGTEGWMEGTPSKYYSSLEDVHDTLHALIGGAGQMGQISVAAFDPVFWSVSCFAAAKLSLLSS